MRTEQIGRRRVGVLLDRRLRAAFARTIPGCIGAKVKRAPAANGAGARVVIGSLTLDDVVAVVLAMASLSGGVRYPASAFISA